MAILDIEVPDDLLAGIKRLALRQHGDDGEGSLARVVTCALYMRLLWLRLLDGSNSADTNPIDEPIIEWQFDERSAPEERMTEIGQWLFRRN